MTASRDPDRLIHDFLFEGEEQLQDQVYDAVRAEIEQKRQRAGFGLWRTPTMNKFVAIGLGAAAVVVALFVGSSSSVRPTPLGGPGADSTPTATAEPTREPTPTPSAEAGLPEGPFRRRGPMAPMARRRSRSPFRRSGWTYVPSSAASQRTSTWRTCRKPAILLWA